MERWVAEIRLRAVIRIGELSRELEKGKHGGKGGGSKVPLMVLSKIQILKSAGISKSQAQRSERLADHKETKKGK